MSVIYVLIPIAILLTAIGIYLFFWAVKTEQFDDLEKQGMSILFEDDNDKSPIDKSNNTAPTNDQIDDNDVPQEQVNKQIKNKL
ncbi:cbb3-type cytochrome oxidase assembly protein CcoS [Colwellia sp. C1TZA3]|uniref:cbb3-type cytochrome oxidase assembly protein CcoS n=1 Tax=Colwellia sp. C1TZA3 TaxID=2508879 RepID=UPI0011B9DBA6|nr:cbb3-type cytochrome oxidase assembly protein CcoS [Colwellia sp. C1TZA3]TWX73358.1 cbb3-type cytochrome oxidase assembly protein CcoS [Colwellia sp. C1TZA3]